MKRLITAMFLVLAITSMSYAAYVGLDLYDGDGNRVGQVISKGMLDNGKWGVQVFVEPIGKFARVAPINSLYADIIDSAPHGWGMFVSDSIGVWEGAYFTSGSDPFRNSNLFPAEYCEECASIFPIKLPYKYVPVIVESAP